MGWSRILCLAAVVDFAVAAVFVGTDTSPGHFPFLYAGLAAFAAAHLVD
jgi:hypothetical protein